MGWWRRTVRGLSILLLLLPLVDVGAAFASPTRWAVCGRWRHVDVTDGRGSVTDVAVVSPTDAWAITDYGYESFNRSYVYRWHGTRWSRVRIPSPSTGDPPFWTLEALAVVSSTEIWAVGSERRYGTGFTRPITARWNGRRWRWVHVGIPNLRGELDGATIVRGTHRVWAVGHIADATYGQRRTFVLLWNGREWRHVVSPAPGKWSEFSDAVSVRGTTWAVGTMHPPGGSNRLLAARWTGDRWLVRKGPRGTITAADGVRRDALWAVGRTRGRGSSRGLIARWNGAGWVLARRFDRVESLADIVVPSLGDAWAVGSSWVQAAQADRPFVLHRGSGRWRIDWSPSITGKLTAIDGSPHNLWAPRAYHAPATAEIASFDAYHRC